MYQMYIMQINIMDKLRDDINITDLEEGDIKK